jgi:hypothetical protein
MLLKEEQTGHTVEVLNWTAPYYRDDELER